MSSLTHWSTSAVCDGQGHDNVICLSCSDRICALELECAILCWLHKYMTHLDRILSLVRLTKALNMMKLQILTLYIRPKCSSTSGLKAWSLDSSGSLKPHKTSCTVRFINTSMPMDRIHIDTAVFRKKE